jgi:D-lactate dehydrogenase (cytochrome)
MGRNGASKWLLLLRNYSRGEAIVALAKLQLDPVIDGLRQLLGERLSTAEAVRLQHGHDESYHAPLPPDAVAFAQSTAEVAEIVKLCARHDCPVIPFGTGTSLEGQVMALKGGVSIDLTGMGEIIEVHQQDLDCRVQAGVTDRKSVV